VDSDEIVVRRVDELVDAAAVDAGPAAGSHVLFGDELDGAGAGGPAGGRHEDP
jgi:hypothetical protein